MLPFDRTVIGSGAPGRPARGPHAVRPGAWRVDPGEARELWMRYQGELAKIWSAAGAVRQARDAPPGPGDRRFAAPEWRRYPYFDVVAQAHLATTRFWVALADAAEAAPIARRRLRFFARQVADALAPSNFVDTNPEALKLALATEGDSLRRGLENLVADLARGRIAMSEPSAFEVGRNLAVTPGAVVFRNELIELIQYRPSTASVHARPLVMVPPCINKYYILDLQPENSFVRHALGRGHQVFMISWRNIPPELGRLTWDDYMEMGVLRALDVARAITGAPEANVLGFCVGGAFTASALAVLAARGPVPVASATYLTTLLDYEEPGEIAVYVDESALAGREAELMAGGRVAGRELAQAFASLRANELIWFFVVNNYLKGRAPAAFDLLHWNADSTNLPGPMYVWYLRNLYLGNRLKDPGALSACGEPLDLGSVRVPSYVLATREDHIVPWESAYRSVHLLGGRNRFVLGASGHIAGSMNPASKNRRSYWTADALPPRAGDWLAAASEHPGSWWIDWAAWLEPHGGGIRPAPRRLGGRGYPPLGPAPGRYVLEPA